MNSNLQELLENGFIILRNVIAPNDLESLRKKFETLVHRQRKIWHEEHIDTWETGAQPRLSNYERLIDEDTAATVEMWQQENTLGVAHQLLSVPDHTSVSSMMLMCSPQQDHGPAAWHRDIHPLDMAPMAVLKRDLLENGPKYIQWNVPLYDDIVFWAVPGSHRRLNTYEENRQLEENPRVPMPGGIPIELNAGDGVVYVNYLLHWGSNYSTTLRRTIHGGHSIFPCYSDTEFMRHVSANSRAEFQSWNQLSHLKQNLTEQALRSVINKDSDSFWEAIRGLQPGSGDKGMTVLLIYLSKAAYHILVHKQSRNSDFPRWAADNQHPISINWGPQFSERFTATDAEKLWGNFSMVDRYLRSESEQFAPGYQNREPMFYYFEDIAPNFGVEEFVNSWTD